MPIFNLDDDDDLKTGLESDYETDDESDRDEFGVKIDDENFDQVKTDEDIFYEKEELTPEQQKLIQQKYHIEQLLPLFTFPGHFVFNGPSGSGKSECCNYILSQVKHNFNHIFVFSGTWDTYQYLRFTSKEQHRPINMDMIKAYINAIVRKKKEGSNAKHLIIFDDFSGLMCGRYVKEIDSIVTMCRHVGVSIFFICHWLSNLSRTCLESTKYFIIFNATQKALQLVSPLSRYKDTELYNIYRANSTEKYSFMLMQKEDSYKKQIYFCNPIDKLVKINPDNIENESW